MGRLIRDHDWASTPLGSVEGWSKSLLGAVNILMSCRMPMFIWWGNDLVQFYNDAYRPSFGNEGKHPTALGQRGEECWPEIWPVIYPLIRQVLDTGESTWHEDQLIPIYRNGRLEDVYWTFSYSPIMEENGAPAGVLVVCSENTHKIQHFQRLQESEDQLSFAVEATELGTWDYNPMSGKFKTNARLKSWFGLLPDEELELPLAIAAMLKQDRDRVTAAIQRALQFESGGYYDVIYTIFDKGNTERIVHAKGRAWFNEDKIAYRFNGTLQDITIQEKARLDLEQAKERARLAIESADLGTYEVDLTTDMLTSSDRFNAIWGQTHTVSRNDLIQLIHPGDRNIRMAANRDALITGNIDYETRILWQDRSEHWIRVKGVVSYDSESKPVRITGVVQDITEQKRSEETLTLQVLERTLALQKSNDDLTQFAHVISHDLKEPVRKVKIFGSRIIEEFDAQLPPRGHLYLQKIATAADRMSDMIDGVLNYSSLSAANNPFAPVDLDHIFQQLEHDLEILIHQKSARVRRTPLPIVRGIPVLIYQLFYNLLNNALKFSRPSIDPIIDVASSIIDNERFISISIADNGIGFDNTFSASIFETFTRLNSKDRFEGTGLGLSLCRRIVERHGGTISATGRPDLGATFVLTLPMDNNYQEPTTI